MEHRRVPAAIRNVSFPVAVFGYDRHAVESYVARVNRLIAELEATHSPAAAIRHALEQADDQTHAILQRARETAGEITERAREQGDEIIARAKVRAADIVVNASTEVDRTKAEADEHVARAMTQAAEILAESLNEADERLQRSREEVAGTQKKAEAWARQFRADTEAIWRERRELLDDVRELAARLATAVGSATDRLPPGERSELYEESVPAAADAPPELREAVGSPDGSAS